MINLPLTKTFVQDITEQEAVKKIIDEELLFRNGNTTLAQIDVIISDMAPDTVGNK